MSSNDRSAALPLLTRRGLLAATGATILSSTGGAPAAANFEVSDRPADEPFGYCLNTSTISGQKLPLTEVVEIAAKAGYRAVEPWIREITAHVDAGGSLSDLRKRIEANGLTVESAIGFAEWAVDDDARRAKGMETAKRDLDLLAGIGGKRIAAPPAGATDVEGISPRKLAERYRALVDLGRVAGIVPQVEVWGFSKCLSRLGEALHVAAECDRDQALVLADVYHLHRGGSGFRGLHLCGPNGMQVFHVNDYPAGPAAALNDAMRVYPGDGVAPLSEIFRGLHSAGFRGWISLELFNRDYWKQDALLVAKTGLEKMRSAVRAAFA
ncbi:MAG: sugar phosphate isomerase/epimerase family protein [Isosphaeraceae bacterium]|nr:sugar phosphate isomerase/epimerase family protein [Isosphaeraceae bacterium]